MITEKTNFNIPERERDKLNKIGEEIAYNFVNLTPERVFELVAKAWYLGDSYGTYGKYHSKNN